MDNTLRWPLKIILILIVIAVAIYSLRANVPDNKFSKSDPADGAAFQFVRGQPWVRLKLGGSVQWVLFDTGATFTTISQDWLKQANAEFFGTTTTNSLLGNSHVQWATVNEITFAGQLFRLPQIISRASNVSVLGANFLLQLPHLLLSKSGLSYGKKIADTDHRVVECMNVTFEHDGQNSEATAAYLHMNINGEIQPVLLDTGSAFLLVGTANDMPKKSWLPEIPRYNLFKAGAGSYGFVKYYSRTAKVKLGNTAITADYMSFPSRSRSEVKFFLGAPILDQFDIYLDAKSGRACFLSR